MPPSPSSRAPSRPSSRSQHQGRYAPVNLDAEGSSALKVPPAVPRKDGAKARYGSIREAIDSIQSASSNDGQEDLEKPKRRQSGWKPWTLHPLFLGLLAAISILMFVALQLLWGINEDQGGVLFAPNMDAFSTTQVFLYAYLPTIVSVALGLAWSCIDLQAKRVEPWLQLSKKKAAPAEESLLLSYPTDFALFIPVRAAIKMHYVTFFASFTALLLSLAVTPSIGAIFKTTSLPTSLDTTARLAGLPSVADQDTFIRNVQFSNAIGSAARGIIHSNATTPPFSTLGYALTPFYVKAPGPADNDQTQAIANTTKWEFDVKCRYGIPNATTYHGGIIAGLNETYGTIQYSDGQGCTLDVNLNGSVPNYRAWSSINDVPCCGSKTRNNYTLNDTCPPKMRWTVSFTNASDFPSDSAQLVHFCSLVIYQQNVTATVFTSNSSVVSATPLGSRTEVGFNSVLDLNILQNVLGRVMKDVIGNDTVTVQEAYQQAVSAFYVSTLAMLWLPANASSMTVPAIMRGHGSAVVMDRTFTIIAQVTLMVSAAFTLGLLVASAFLKSKLEEDPSSIAKMAKLLRQNQFGSVLSEVNKDRGRSFGHHIRRYNAFMYQPNDHMHHVLETQLATSSERAQRGAREDVSYVRPPELTVASGVVLQLSLLAGIVGFTVLLCLGANNEGLPWTATSPFVQRLLLSYIPTLFATAIDATFILIARTTAVLKPFEDLQARPTAASKSVCLGYLSMIPQFMCITAARMKHYTLFVLGLTSILALVLPVGMSSLFVLETSTITRQIVVSASSNTTFLPIQASHYDIPRNALAKSYMGSYLSNRSALAPWTTESSFFVPVLTNDAYEPSSNYSSITARTRGFETDATCRPITLRTRCTPLEVPISNKTFFGTRVGFWDKDCPQNATTFANFTLSLPGGSNTSIGLGNWTRTYSFLIDNYFDNIKRSVSWDYDFYYTPGPLYGMRDYLGSGQSTDISKRQISGARPSSSSETASSDPPPQEMQVIFNSAFTNLSLGDTAAPPYLLVGYFRNNLLGPNQMPAPHGAGSPYSLNSTGVMIACGVDLRSAMFDVTFRPDTHEVLHTSQLDDWEPADRFFPNGQREKDQYLSLAMNDLDTAPDMNPWNLGTSPLLWTNRYLASLQGNNEFLDPKVKVVDPKPLTAPLERVIKLWVAARAAHNGDWWKVEPTPQEEQEAEDLAENAQARRVELRVKFGKSMYELVIAILIWDLIIATWVYWRPHGTHRYLPRLPNSIAATLSFVAGSACLGRIAHEQQSEKRWQVLQARQSLKGHEHQNRDDDDVLLAYGRYIGPDGYEYIGIEYADNVTRLTKADTMTKTKRANTSTRNDDEKKGKMKERLMKWIVW